MFVLISTLISVAILVGIYHLADKRAKQHARKYRLLILLRDVTYLLRRHRAVTHHTFQDHQNHDEEIATINQELRGMLHQLIETSRFENKPMYRVLQIKVEKLLKQWQEHSLARNQLEHGRLIRHTLFLMDEVTIAWLAVIQREDLYNEYQMNWQTVIDNLETLTQLRISIQDIHTPDGAMRIKNYASVMIRKLNQLAVITPLSITAPMPTKSIHTLNEYINDRNHELNEDELYRITSEFSLAIFNSYEQILSDIVETIYRPLPTLRLA
ncbi:hypothetical protein ACOMICROBIO_GDFFDHBD_03565 [Vibrio sp. B1REV9]|uniref:hypothetical protein n=1 Tax=Vibrio sp. B1REV9 TaxID=2751179 RepID=UPI001B2D52CA|nr:hypothetical protein [Vibrio sp. B1REV9]CAE6949798.1 hypothetical protein ACOMICROBIO_GDFFDHBD_03565 [Vibrio sp. B1REV9]